MSQKNSKLIRKYVTLTFPVTLPEREYLMGRRQKMLTASCTRHLIKEAKAAFKAGTLTKQFMQQRIEEVEAQFNG